RPAARRSVRGPRSRGWHAAAADWSGIGRAARHRGAKSGAAAAVADRVEAGGRRMHQSVAESISKSAPMLSVNALLRPRAIALVGISAKGGAGANILRSGERFGFIVPTWPVHPNAAEIGGHRCYKSLRDLPQVPDCVVIAVPAEAVLDVLGEAAAAGIRSAYVVSEGFADAATDAGRERQERLVTFARAANMAVAGPNCMGL